MHRMTINLQNRKNWILEELECQIFKRTINAENIAEARQFFKIMIEESHIFYKKRENMAADLMEKYKISKDAGYGLKHSHLMRLISTVIMQAPVESIHFEYALLDRGSFYYSIADFESAIRDFEMLLLHHPSAPCHIDSCIVFGKLVICYYYLYDHVKAKGYYMEYKKLRSNMQFETDDDRQLIEFIDKQINNFVEEFTNIENNMPKSTTNIWWRIPYKGYNASQAIPLSSSVCQYRGINGLQGVFATETIPKGSVVCIENPIYPTLNTPFVQCEVCFTQRSQMFTCLRCRIKTYCSFSCLNGDWHEHQSECKGYFDAVLLVLDATVLYRIFVRVSKILNKKIFHKKIVRSCKTANEIFSIGLQLLVDSTNNIPYINMLTNKPNYRALKMAQYQTLVTTCFRLAIYIENHTNILRSYYRLLNITNEEKILLVGGLLMRIHGHLLNDTYDFQYMYPKQQQQYQHKTTSEIIKDLSCFIKPEELSTIPDCMNAREIKQIKDKYVSNNRTERMSIRRNSDFEHLQNCGSIRRLYSVYNDQIVAAQICPDQTYFLLRGEGAMSITSTASSNMCKYLNELYQEERYKFIRGHIRNYHKNIYNYFYELQERTGMIEQIFSLYCTTLNKFRHSCAPNVRVVVLANGYLICKTMRDIKSGEELFTNQKAHFMYHRRSERLAFLSTHKISCNCRYCTMPETEEPINKRLGVICDKCFKVITNADWKCKCQHMYHNVFAEYQTVTKNIQKAITTMIQDTDDVQLREISAMYDYLFNYVNNRFVPTHETRLNVELDYAKFLALIDKSQDAANLIKKIAKNIKKHYDVNVVCFTFYAKLLLIIKIILHKNIGERSNYCSTKSLKGLCSIAFQILEWQKDELIQEEEFDMKGIEIIENMKECSYYMQALVIGFDDKC